MKRSALVFFNILYALLALAYLVYVTGRAYYIPVTHDEGATCVLFGKLDYNAVIRYAYGYISGNNHVLNTLSVKFWSDLTGYSPLGIRAGNLLAAVLYLVAGYLLFRHFFQTTLLRVLGVVLWLGNPYLGEFFALARGYGMSAGLQAASMSFGAMYLASAGHRRAQLQYLILACLSAALMVWANFATLYFYLCFAALLGWQMLRHFKTSKGHLIILLGISALLAALIWEPLRKIRAAGDFTWFGTKGFFEDTVQGLADCYLMGQRYSGPETLVQAQWLLTALFVAITVDAITLVRRSGGNITPMAWLLGLLPGTVAVNLAVTAFTDTSFLSTRTTLLYYPLLACATLALFALLETRWPKITWALAAPFVVLGGMHFFKNANWKDTYEWRFDRDTYTVLDYIEKTYRTENPAAPYSFHVYCLQYPSFLFHTRISESGYNNYVQEVKDTGCNISEPVNKEVEFYFVPREKAGPFAADYLTVLETSGGERVLLRKKPL